MQKDKKIALFGASGQTGKAFVARALDEGYTVVALVRNPEKITQQSPNLVCIGGDVLNPTAVEQTIDGADLVVSLIGHVKGSPRSLQTDGVTNMVAAMKKHGVRRIISLTGGGVPYPEKDQPKFADKLIVRILRWVAADVLTDGIRHAEVLQNSGLQWLIVRGPRLTNNPAKGHFRVGWVGVNASTQISRADLATFLVTQIADESHDYTMPFISD